MPLISRAQSHPNANRLPDGLLPMLPLFRKNETTTTRRPPPKAAPSRPREKSHSFLRKQLHHSTAKRRRDKYDKQPLLQEEKRQEKMHLTRSLETYKKKVMEDGEHGKESPLKPRDFFVESSPRVRSSENSHVTATTASGSSGSTSGSWYSGATLSPPLSPASQRAVSSPTDFDVVPFDEEVEDIDVEHICEDLFARYDLEEDESSTTVLVSYSGGVEVVPEAYPPIIPEDEPLYISHEWSQEYESKSVRETNPTNYLLKLVEDCEARWNSYSQSLRDMSLMPVLSRAPTDDSSSSRDNTSGRSSPEPAQNHLIAPQHEDIEYLKADLLRQRDLLVREEEACDRLYPAPLEQIDTIPVEEIEVTVDQDDNVSVTSAMTEINDVSKLNDDSASVFAAIPPSRPDAASVIGDEDVVLNKKQVQNMPLKLWAANGTLRRALYTGPCTGGACTGVGTLRFETGDTYMGEIVNGKVRGKDSGL